MQFEIGAKERENIFSFELSVIALRCEFVFDIFRIFSAARVND